MKKLIGWTLLSLIMPFICGVISIFDASHGFWDWILLGLLFDIGMAIIIGIIELVVFIYVYLIED